MPFWAIAGTALGLMSARKGRKDAARARAQSEAQRRDEFINAQLQQKQGRDPVYYAENREEIFDGAQRAYERITKGDSDAQT